MADNVQKLMEAGVIPQGAELTNAELEVIESLSDEEMSTLIGIRKKLGEAAQKPDGKKSAGTLATASVSSEDELGISPNFIV